MASVRRRNSSDEFASSPDSERWTLSDSDSESTVDEMMDDSLTSLQWLQNMQFHLDVSENTLDGCEDKTGESQQLPGCAATAVQVNANTPTTGTTTITGQNGSGRNEDVDYRTNAHLKPPYSYATLICMAMKATNQTKITLSCIYKWIMENFMYYRKADPGWQVSVVTLVSSFRTLCNRMRY